MNKNQRNDAELTQIIIKLIQNEKPQDVQQLVKIVEEKISIPEPKIIEHIIQLQTQGKISLKDLPASVSQKLGTYLKTKEAYWYWITLVLITTTTITVFTISENAYPIIYARYALGAFFVLFLPGYSLIKALFPTKEIDSIERISLSIGMSLALVSITGLILNYTPWGIRTAPITLSLLALTIVFATAGIIREHQSQLGKTHN